MLTGQYRYRVATTGMLWWKRNVLVLQFEHQVECRRWVDYPDFETVVTTEYEWTDAEPEDVTEWMELQHERRSSDERRRRHDVQREPLRVHHD